MNISDYLSISHKIGPEATHALCVAIENNLSAQDLEFVFGKSISKNLLSVGIITDDGKIDKSHESVQVLFSGDGASHMSTLVISSPERSTYTEDSATSKVSTIVTKEENKETLIATALINNSTFCKTKEVREEKTQRQKEENEETPYGSIASFRNQMQSRQEQRKREQEKRDRELLTTFTVDYFKGKERLVSLSEVQLAFNKRAVSEYPAILSTIYHLLFDEDYPHTEFSARKILSKSPFNVGLKNIMVRFGIMTRTTGHIETFSRMTDIYGLIKEKRFNIQHVTGPLRYMKGILDSCDSRDAEMLSHTRRTEAMRHAQTVL